MNDWERVGNDRPGVPLDSLGLASAPPQAIQIRGYAANHANGSCHLSVGSWQLALAAKPRILLAGGGA